MKAPDLGKLWSNLPSRRHSIEYPRAIELSPRLNLPSSIEIPSQVSVLFGMNGVGKSRLLHAIAESIDSAVLLELNNLISYMRNEIGKRDDIPGLMEETSPMQLKSATELAICDLVRRDYEHVNWYAVPIADSPFVDLVNDEVVPIFEVQYSGSTYDFRGMGLGELSAHLLLWLLEYRRDGPEQRMLLMDEPEAFLPAPSRRVIMSYILDASSRGNYPVVLASHSIELIQPAIEAGAGVLVS